jgi:hypothetical protein
VSLVDGRAAWFGFAKLYALYCRLKARKSYSAGSKVGHYASFGANPAGRDRNINDSLKGNSNDAARVSESGGLVKVYDWSSRAADLRQWGDWRVRSGFIGHDGLPWFWEESRSCWVPVTESSHAGAYAASRARNVSSA